MVQSAAPATEQKLRCKICTFLSPAESQKCTRCKEPFAPNAVPESVPLPRAPETAPKAAPAPAQAYKTNFSAKPNTSRPAATSKAIKTIASFAKPSKRDSAAKATKIDSTPHKGELGYQPRKNNVHGLVQSKLNHDTASYRAKHDLPGDGAKIATIKSLTRNGFTTSLSKPSSGSHDDKAAPRPAKYDTNGGKGKSGGLIGYLQAAASGSAVASLKHKPASVAPSVKAVGEGQYTKLAL